jgi:hypothetical protein
MTESDKAAQRSTLIFQFGKLLAPLFELADKTMPPTAADYQIVTARCMPDRKRWSDEVDQFVSFGEYRFAHLYDDILREPNKLLHEMPKMARSIADDASRQADFRDRLIVCRDKALTAIDLVPIQWTARLHEAMTPFSIYLKFRDAIGTAKRRVHYFDRYLDTEFFNLYLRDLSRSVEVRLVTTIGRTNFGVTNVLSVSNLAAREFVDYQLIECLPGDLHDRNLRVDDTVFFLGTSIKDAGTQPTNFSPADSSPSGHSVLDSIMTNGKVVSS